jgi:hypothetical protein
MLVVVEVVKGVVVVDSLGTDEPGVDCVLKVVVVLRVVVVDAGVVV